MTDSFAQLHEQLTDCRLCYEAGYEIHPPPVFTHGVRSRLMLIGQAPGSTEVVAQRMFNAGSGRRLFQWLGEAGWEEDYFRAHYYMSAVTKCYPGRNKSGRGDRVPSKEEQQLCRPYLEREIRLMKPELLILVGGLATKLLYPAKSKLREIIGTAVYFAPDQLEEPVNFRFKEGKVVDSFDARLVGGRYIVPLPHPSGASLWPNDPENGRLIKQAIKILRDIRIAKGL